jgi:hypothetical protein
VEHFAHFLEEFRLGVIVPPAAASAEFDEMLLATLDQCEPSACNTVVRTRLPIRHEGKPKAPVKSALPDIQRDLLIRATEMNVASRGVFVDFLFVDKSGQK